MMQEWFRKAKLGIFLHWGIYSVNGTGESWPIGRGEISYDDYTKQMEMFTAAKYDPEKWAALFKKAGATYVVLTAKHHDGVALFNTKYTDRNVVKNSPAGRDLLAPYCKAMQRAGLKTGVYFTNTDWADIDHLSVILNKMPEEIHELRKQKYAYNAQWTKICGKAAPPAATEEQKAAWERFMARYKGEITELLTNYGEIDLLWFDVMLTRNGFSWDSENIKKYINTISPKTVVNSRLGAYGDYQTPECYIPLRALEGEWELCTTFNESWGYQPQDKKYKSLRQLVRILVECITKGGNLLISARPTPEGEIPPEQEKLLLSLGEWTSKYAEAIYPTEKGLPSEYFAGGSTMSKDNKTLYLFAYDKPQDKLLLNGIRTKISKITALKNGENLSHECLGGAPWLNMPGCIWIDVPQRCTEDVCAVLRIDFEAPIDMVALTTIVKSAGEN